MTDFRKEQPNPWPAPKKPILSRVNDLSKFLLVKQHYNVAIFTFFRLNTVSNIRKKKNFFHNDYFIWHTSLLLLFSFWVLISLYLVEHCYVGWPFYKIHLHYVNFIFVLERINYHILTKKYIIDILDKATNLLDNLLETIYLIVK